MTLLPLSCLCIIVFAWPLSCLPATMEHPTGTGLTCGDGRCVCNATHAYCRGKSLYYIPKFPAGITSLDFSLNKPLNTGRAGFLDNVTDIHWLDLSQNSNLSFRSETLNRFVHLTHLDLSRCHMSYSTLSAVFKIPSLEVLRLRAVKGCDGFKFLNITTPMPRLQELDLSSIMMDPYPDFSYMWSFTGLRRFVLNYLYMAEAESTMFLSFHDMNLTYVDMSYTSLPCEVAYILLDIPSLQELKLADSAKCRRFKFTLEDRRTNMTRLDLSQNEIATISPLSLPAGLKYLNVSMNRLKSMRFVRTLIHLEVLDMATNLLESHRPVCLPALQHLNLSHNEIYDNFLPRKSSCFPNLTTLTLRLNQIPIYICFNTVIHLSRYFPNLKVLDVSEQRNVDLFPLRETDEVLPVQHARLKSLNLADNHIDFQEDNDMFISAGTLQECPNLSSLSLANNRLSAVSEERFLQLFGHMVHLERLSLRSSGLRFIKPAMFRNFRALICIDLSYNSLITVPSGMLASVPNLRILDLSFNKIAVVQESIFSDSTRHRLQRVDLSANPLTCSCDVLWFRSWLLYSPSVFAQSSSDYLCANLPTTPIISFSMTEQACLLSQETSRFIIATVSLIFLGLSSLTFVYRYRWQIRLVLHEVFRGNGDRARHLRHHRFQYDVFVCYDSKDFPWVHDHLMPNLEKDMGLKLCLHNRDFIPGTPIVDNILDSAVASKKMLMLFSRQFAKSPWCQLELRLCFAHAMDTQDVLIVVLLEDIPSRELTSSMIAVMKTITYIEWADEAEARDSFWRRIGLSLYEVLPKT